MALPMNNPYRGYAPVTHDTNRIAETITELNSLNTTVSGKLSSSHAGSDGHSGVYSPSAVQYYLETNNGNGSGTVQSIPNTTFTTLDVAGTVASNNGGGFNSTTDIYTLPAGGIYCTQALIRVVDSMSINFQLGVGVHTSNADGYWFQWNKYFTGAGGRFSADYTRVASFSGGDQLRLYAWQDTGGFLAITAINWSVWRIG